MVRDDNKYHSFEREIDQWRMRRKDANDRKVVDEVFDKRNLMRLYKMFSDGVIERLDFPIATGKEGNVFRATTPKGGFVAVKIYRTTTATFKDMAKYVQGDPRFKGISNNRKRLILAWAAKEYSNLRRLTDAGVRVPKPHMLMSQSAPATALSRNGGTEYRIESVKHTPYARVNGAGSVSAAARPAPMSESPNPNRCAGGGGGFRR